jgi:hypothetical protein
MKARAATRRGDSAGEPEERRQPYGKDSQVLKECAQVDYFPEESEPFQQLARCGAGSGRRA